MLPVTFDVGAATVANGFAGFPKAGWPKGDELLWPNAGAVAAKGLEACPKTGGWPKDVEGLPNDDGCPKAGPFPAGREGFPNADA